MGEAEVLVEGSEALVWRKSAASNPSGACVELAELDDGGIAMRNSRFPAGERLVCARAEIAALVFGIRAGEFDDLTVEPARAGDRRSSAGYIS